MGHTEELRLLESIIEACPAIVFRWIIQDGWPVEYVSRNIERLGYTREDMLSGAVSWPGITHPDDVPRLEAEVKQYLADGVERWSQTYRIAARDGTYRWIRDWNLLVRDEEGVPRKIQGIIIDVTREQTAEEQRVVAQVALEKALAEVISGFLPICSQCKAVRDSSGTWAPIEDYIVQKHPVQFSHGYCPSCLAQALDDADRDSNQTR